MSTSPYNEAGKLLTRIITEHKSLKTLAFSKNKSKAPCSKVAYAQVCHTLQHKSILESILNHDEGRLRKNIQADEVRNIGLLYVLLYELLFGRNGKIRGGGRLKRNIMKFEKELKEVKGKLMKDGGDGIEKAYVFPRYIRINTLKTTMEEVVDTLQKDLTKSQGGTGTGTASSEDTQCIFCDPHVPDLLVISPEASIQWHQHELVTSGKIVLQDKSSCFSALAMVHGTHTDEPLEGDYMDACAAPGNKTSHLAALIHKSQSQSAGVSKKGNQLKTTPCKIFAFDRSSSRISILRDRLSKLVPLAPAPDQSGTQQSKSSLPEVLTIHEDFLKVDPKDKTYKKVKCILLDPSCSGSGIIDTPDRLLRPADRGGNQSNGEKGGGKRVETLSNFQLLILKHAMSFPQVQRIVYSTCSVHDKENEHVVASALDEANEQIEEDALKWSFVSPLALQGWGRRGHEVSGLTEEQANCLARVDGTDGDNTNGFFVSYFERKGASETISTKLSSAKSLVTLVPGVKALYDGEFNNLNNVAPSDEIDNNNEEVKEITPAIVENGNDKQKGSETVSQDSTQIKAKSKMAKKKSKKILW
eukprot:CAMPEP_0198278522 /NCGR_PEP_ID=MMETSP1447-20131203/66421_1 /TAXON_ID=420782 /ORGANISM="Chaetoceros dichaeta, Strain CCMP1751" /LENGTH=585 /DNA_ID=CAMNT_0043973607 /DNA_START=41 /DNA_END=1795 /DNA_ORIENTATION=+